MPWAGTAAGAAAAGSFRAPSAGSLHGSFRGASPWSASFSTAASFHGGAGARAASGSSDAPATAAGGGGDPSAAAGGRSAHVAISMPVSPASAGGMVSRSLSAGPAAVGSVGAAAAAAAPDAVLWSRVHGSLRGGSMDGAGLGLGLVTRALSVIQETGSPTLLSAQASFVAGALGSPVAVAGVDGSVRGGVAGVDGSVRGGVAGLAGGGVPGAPVAVVGPGVGIGLVGAPQGAVGREDGVGVGGAVPGGVHESPVSGVLTAAAAEPEPEAGGVAGGGSSFLPAAAGRLSDEGGGGGGGGGKSQHNSSNGSVSIVLPLPPAAAVPLNPNRQGAGMPTGELLRAVGAGLAAAQQPGGALPSHSDDATTTTAAAAAAAASVASKGGAAATALVVAAPPAPAARRAEGAGEDGACTPLGASPTSVVSRMARVWVFRACSCSLKSRVAPGTASRTLAC